MFSVGDKIVYPMHGAGVIREIEEKEILGQKRFYYILQLPGNDMNVMIPVDMEQTAGIRRIVSQDMLQEVEDLLRAESTPMASNWNRRHRENMEKLRSGDILQVAEVVRNLIRSDRRKNLAAGEKKMLAGALQILISELVLAGNMDIGDARRLIEESV
ncbi:MAG: CarD family transcriptional regulator [Firmicutes bacterium]|nr:CarD family transcriptional regulator [Bacillota bacterium]MDD7603091.1 CarD family transcriptional regulator [Bacillota bacterium]MDY5856403.1 CarD family transcriptional regulator [Anaerovoracaceae bacterium]